MVFTAGPPGEGVVSAGAPEVKSPVPPGENPWWKKLARLFLWPDSRVFWLLKFRKLKEVARDFRPDLILATAPPYTPLIMAYKLGYPYAIDLWDPWLDNFYDMYPTPLHRALTARWERKAFTRAKALFAVNPPTAETIKKRYPSLRVEVIPHGHDPMPRQPMPPGERFVLSYVGSLFGEHKRVEGLVEGLLRLPPDAPISFRFIGGKSKRTLRALKRLAARFPVEARAFVPHDEALNLMLQSHGLLLLTTRGPHYELVSPGKLGELLGAGRAVLAVVPKDTWLWRFVESWAYTADPDEPESIKRAVLKMLEDWRAGRLRVPPPELGEEYLYERVLEKMERVLRGVAGA